MALWTPDRINTALWLDAADPNTRVMVGDDLAELEDKSGGNHTAVSASGHRATIASGEINGLDVTRFDGTNAFMDVLDSADLAGESLTLVMVIKDPASLQAIYAGVICKGIHNGDGWELGYNSGYEEAFLSGPASVEYNGRLYTSILCVECRPGTPNEIEIFRNGVSVATATHSGSLSSSYGVQISNRRHNTDRRFRGDIGEISVLDHHSTLIRQKIEGYLAHKWGLAASLPAEHPYKDSAPIVLGLFDGTITDKDGNPAERRITVLDTTGQCVATDTSDPVTGAYSITVPAESPYTLVFDGEPDRNAQVFANVIPGESPA